MVSRSLFWVLICAVALTGCAGRQPTSDPGGITGLNPARHTGRTLVIIARTEGETVAGKGLANAGIAGLPTGPFNGALVSVDANEVVSPYLAVAVPQLNTDSWRVFADGRMETTYQLKPGLTWHDGRPLTTEDFVFAHRIYGNPAYGQTATAPPLNLIEDISAPDDRSIQIRWSRPYADAAALNEGRFQALPSHLLADAAQRLTPEAFAAHPFWTVDYVGLGAYRVVRWERGLFLEGEAFDGYVFGRPAIDRIRMQIIPDSNTALANMLAGEAHVIGDDDVVSFQQAVVLKRQWDADGGGSVSFIPGGARRTENQFVPAYADPKAILDLRVRKALAHAVDRQALNDVIFDGLGVLADTLISPIVAHFPEIERGLTKYPYDVRRSEQLMNEAGISKGQDGFYVSPTEGRLNFEIKALSNERNEAAMQIMAASWRNAGFEMTETVFPSTMLTDREARAKFRSMFSTDGGALPTLGTVGAPNAENRWTGSNRGSWSHAEFDGLASAHESTLDRSERTRLLAQMARIYSDELPSTPIWYQVTPVAHFRAVRGPKDDTASDIHLWQWVD
jgi:peptide/nickel transport system substrate-binding protein